MLRRSTSLSSTTRRSVTVRSSEAPHAGEGPPSDFGSTGFCRDGEAPQLDAPPPALVAGDDVDGDVAVPGSCLRRSRTTQPAMSGRRRSSVMASGVGRLGQLQGHLAPRGDQALEAHLVGHVQQDRGELGVVLDDEEEAVARLEVVAVAADVHLGDGRRRPRGRRRRTAGVGRARVAAAAGRRRARPRPALRPGRWPGGW